MTFPKTFDAGFADRQLNDFNASTGVVHNAFTEAEAFGPYQPPATLESVKQRAAQLNANGRIAQKFGMKILVHNHTGEFEKLTDRPSTTYDVLRAETDPSLVTMQLDIGWAYIAGVDPIALFKQHPAASSCGTSRISSG